MSKKQSRNKISQKNKANSEDGLLKDNSSGKGVIRRLDPTSNKDDLSTKDSSNNRVTKGFDTLKDTEELLNVSSSGKGVIVRFDPKSNYHIEAVATQLLNIEFSIKENEDEYGKLETIVNYLKHSNRRVFNIYNKNNFKKRLAQCNDRDELYHPIRDRMDYSIDERITGEFINNVFSEIDEDDSLYLLFVEFIEFLEFEHRGIFQYMAAKAYIDDFLVEN